MDRRERLDKAIVAMAEASEFTDLVVGTGARRRPGARAPEHTRLHQRWETFTARRKKPVIANVTVARELAGWAWSLAVMEYAAPSTSSAGDLGLAARGTIRVATMGNQDLVTPAF